SNEVNVSYAAVGILYFFIKSFVNDLDPSIIAAALLGPNTLMPAASNASVMPSNSGSSGPITARSIALSFAHAVSLSNSVSLIGTFVATSAIPALPGAQYSFFTFELWL